jgi:hypothetical protein
MIWLLRTQGDRAGPRATQQPDPQSGSILTATVLALAIGVAWGDDDNDGVHQFSEVRPGGSYLSQNDVRPHFGLGAAMKIDSVDIRWPAGKDAGRILPPTRSIRL